MIINGAITYLLVLPDPPESQNHSPFQWFSRDILVRNAIIRDILKLPSSVMELNHEREESLIARLRGCAPYQILPLYVGSVDAIITIPIFPFLCVISDEATVDKLHLLVHAANRPVLHVTTAERINVQPFNSLNRTDLFEYCWKVKVVLESAGMRLPMLDFPQHPPKWAPVALPLEGAGHPVTLPNEMALRSAGFDIANGDNHIPRLDFVQSEDMANLDAPYVKIIMESVRQFEAARAAHLGRACHNRSRLGIDVILTAPAVMSHLLAGHVDRQRHLPVILRCLIKQRRYRHLLIPPRHRPLLSGEIPKEAIKARQLELETYTTGLAVRAAGCFAPVLRLPPGVNKLRGQIVHLAACIGANGSNKERRVSRLARRIGRDLQTEVPNEILEFISNVQGGIKLVADAPLELLPVQDVPLQLRRSVSRVPVTPGNLYSHLMLTSKLFWFTPSELRNILVLRSFADDDPRKRDLEESINAFMALAEAGLSLEWHDIQSSDDLVQAMNSFAGSVMIFDGHGFHCNNEEPGTLIVGDEYLEISALRNRITNVPPIVVLSACDTARADISHATTVNAFLLLGASSVLGSMAPVDSKHSARLVGRLLYRLAEYLPFFEKSSDLVQWSEVVTGLLRMNYVTDMLMVLRRYRIIEINDNETRRIQYLANQLINSFDDSWLEETTRIIADYSGTERLEIEAARKEIAYFTETQQYLHFGWPEDIMVAGSGFAAKRLGQSV